LYTHISPIVIKKGENQMKEIFHFRVYLILLAVPIIIACGFPLIQQETSSTPATEHQVSPTALPASRQTPTRSTSGTSQPNQTMPIKDGVRSWPDTWSGIHVFNDQLSNSMSDEQWEFSATRYDGTQKMTRSDSERLRSINPNFIILHYRLGIGLGYRIVTDGCQPDGDWIAFIEGDDWVQEWPGDENVVESWFYHWPEDSTTRVLNCDWGWYLAELDNNDWREYWQSEIVRQIQVNESDGVFMDSLSVPNFLGADRYSPNLPGVDAAFESAWSERIQNWLSWLQSQPVGDYALIPNAGSWITSRDNTDYSAADGVMIEGFALEADESPYNLEDWQLQMDRTLSLVRQDKIIITQTTVMGDQERMFTLGSYLLLKDHHTYMNIELDLEPEWWPEYDIAIGSPIENAPASISELFVPEQQIYQREFDNALVLVNPTSPWDGTDLNISIDLDGTYYLAQTSGGGNITPEGTPTGTLIYRPVTQVELPPYSAAVLLSKQP
jgi:hypothetical protein